jgi:hypothetical protein
MRTSVKMASAAAAALFTAVTAVGCSRQQPTTLILPSFGSVCLADDRRLRFQLSETLIVDSPDGVPAEEMLAIKNLTKEYMREVGRAAKEKTKDITSDQFENEGLVLNIEGITSKYIAAYQSALGASRKLLSANFRMDPLYSEYSSDCSDAAAQRDFGV